MKTIGVGAINRNTYSFTVWAPEIDKMILHLVYPEPKEISMKKDGQGYFYTEVQGISPGAKYFFRPEGIKDFPDPASHYQPEGVHGPSEIVDHGHFNWTDQNWKGLPFRDLILYEIHVGTFTGEGTFEALIPFLKDLALTGINAIELMPVAQFPGPRNWGYDGVFPYAVQNSYGGPMGLKKLVDASHQLGIAVFLDVVYNHLGPEGNYFDNYGPYFTDKYATPWGKAINFDGSWSDGVREYFSNNPLHWFENYHIDGLRCDAIHEIYDSGAVNFWNLTQGKINSLKQKLGRELHLVAESDLNSPKVVLPPDVGGFGFTAQWLDDFHHAAYVLLDKAGKARYEDFGKVDHLAKAYKEGFVHSGDYVKFRKRKHGASSAGISGDKFLVCNQNHDQIGNRVGGERLSVLVGLDHLKLAAAVILLSPYVPMLFMGEEYGDPTPFFYFVSHSDKELIQAVREGRKKEFEGYNWDTEPLDPQGEETFQRSKIQWNLREKADHKLLLMWYKTLIGLRKNSPALATFNKNFVQVNIPAPEFLVVNRKSEAEDQELVCLFNFSETSQSFVFRAVYPKYKKILDSTERQWGEETKSPHVENPKQIIDGEQIHISPFSVLVYGSEL